MLKLGLILLMSLMMLVLVQSMTTQLLRFHIFTRILLLEVLQQILSFLLIGNVREKMEQVEQLGIMEL